MSVGARLKAECCWSQKQLNHPIFTLPAWQLDGCQTLLHFCICAHFRWFGTQALLRVHMCVSASSFIRLLLILLSSPFSSVRLPVSSALFPAICGLTLLRSLPCLPKTLHLLLTLHHSRSLSVPLISSAFPFFFCLRAHDFP